MTPEGRSLLLSLALAAALLLLPSPAANAQVRLERPTVSPTPSELMVAPRTADFELGPGPDCAVFLFRAASAGSLDVRIEWQGDAGSLHAEVTNIAAAEESGEPAMTLDGSSPLTGSVEVVAGQTGQWGVGLRVERGNARGTISIRPHNARISMLVPKPPELPTVDPAVGRFLSLYFYHVERALSGMRATELDRRLGEIISRASPEVRQTYGMAVQQYRALPLETKVALGFDAEFVEQLEVIDRPLSRQTLQQMGRQIVEPLAEARPVLRPRMLRGAPPAPGGGGDDEATIWSVGLDWTTLVCHDESDACAIDNWGWTCTEAGSDEPVAIFLMLDGAITTEISIDELLEDLSDDAKVELIFIVATGRLSEAMSGDPDVISSATYAELTDALANAIENAELEINEHWVRRTQVFGGVEDGSRRSGRLQLIPRVQGQGPQTLREAGHSWGEGTIEYSVPMLVACALLFELDDGVGGLMDAIESHAESMEAVADELVMDAIMDMLAGGIAGGMAAGLVGGLVAGGPVGILIGMGIGALVAYWMQPEFLGHGEVVFTTQGWTIGAESVSTASLTPLAAERRPLVLRGMFRGSRSDYELRADLTIRSSGLRCRTFAPETTRLDIELGPGRMPIRFHVVDGTGERLVSSRNPQDVQKALRIIRGYGLSSVCELGHPEPAMTWWLADGRPPEGPQPNEDSMQINPNALEVRRVGGEWKIVQGNSWLLGFGDREEEARAALSVLQQYGFTRICFVGRPDAVMQYFRR